MARVRGEHPADVQDGSPRLVVGLSEL
jgi:hypothetical protein